MAYLSYLFFIGILTLIDQYTKLIINTYINEYSSIKVIDNFFYLTNVKNDGAAWSMLAGKKYFFIIITILAILYFTYELIKKKDLTLLNKIADVLIIGGAIGNLIDRIKYGKVTDFLDFYIFGYDFPVFNGADIFLTMGIFLLLISTIIEMIHAKN